MRVAVDYGFARLSGVGAYITALLPEIARARPNDEFVLLRAPRDDAELGASLPANVTSRPGDTPIYSLTEQLYLPWLLRRERGDWFWSPHFDLPLAAPVPTVCTIHDVAYMVDGSDLHGLVAKVYYRGIFRLALRKARMVVVSSEFTRNELSTRFGVAEERILTIPGAPRPGLHPLDPSEMVAARVRLGLPPRYILHLGIKRRRKNLIRQVRAFALISRELPDVSLVLAGPEEPSADVEVRALIKELQLETRVILRGFVAPEELLALYACAALLTYVSLYEGFGLPILEAMASGTPVLTGQETAMAETAGDAAVKVDPFDVEQIADGMKSILCEAGLAADLRARGRARAAHYSWQRSAAMAAGLFEQMAREGHARRR